MVHRRYTDGTQTVHRRYTDGTQMVHIVRLDYLDSSLSWACSTSSCYHINLNRWISYQFFILFKFLLHTSQRLSKLLQWSLSSHKYNQFVIRVIDTSSSLSFCITQILSLMSTPLDNSADIILLTLDHVYYRKEFALEYKFHYLPNGAKSAC
mgnify:CR=1 FL=1